MPRISLIRSATSFSGLSWTVVFTAFLLRTTVYYTKYAVLMPPAGSAGVPKISDPSRPTEKDASPLGFQAHLCPFNRATEFCLLRFAAQCRLRAGNPRSAAGTESRYEQSEDGKSPRRTREEIMSSRVRRDELPGRGRKTVTKQDSVTQAGFSPCKTPVALPKSSVSPKTLCGTSVVFTSAPRCRACGWSRRRPPCDHPSRRCSSRSPAPASFPA